MGAGVVLREDGSCERYRSIVSAEVAIVHEQRLHQTWSINGDSAGFGKLMAGADLLEISWGVSCPRQKYDDLSSDQLVRICIEALESAVLAEDDAAILSSATRQALIMTPTNKGRRASLCGSGQCSQRKKTGTGHESMPTKLAKGRSCVGGGQEEAWRVVVLKAAGRTGHGSCGGVIVKKNAMDEATPSSERTPET
jgi:hypothetical protein